MRVEMPVDQRDAVMDHLPKLVDALFAAYHALRSYESGNGSPDLAREVANHIEKLLGE